MKKLLYLAVVAMAAMATACGGKNDGEQPIELAWTFQGIEVGSIWGGADIENGWEKDTSFFISKNDFTTELYIKFKNDSLYRRYPISLSKSSLNVCAAKIINDTIYTYTQDYGWSKTNYIVVDTVTHRAQSDIQLNDTTECYGYMLFKQ
jgi:opacity protein-like surface antigen